MLVLFDRRYLKQTAPILKDPIPNLKQKKIYHDVFVLYINYF